MTTTNDGIPRPSRGPVQAVLGLFSNIWLGVVLLTLLFVYSSIGSVFHAVRQARGLEMTEYEWFHWWPFNWIIGLLCVNLTVATLRRIPLRPLNYGVWMIHTGIIVLALGSVWYFSTKIEGEAPIARRSIRVTVDGVGTAVLPAKVGASTILAGQGRAWDLSVQDIDPRWEIRSGGDEGALAYKVTLAIDDGETFFMRNILANYPEYTEDMVRTDDPQQPFQRSIKALNRSLVDETIRAELIYEPQTHLYVVHSAAIYVRELGDDAWIERPIDGMPKYQDYIAGADSVWPMPGAELPAPDELDIRVGAVSDDDPLKDTTIRVREYLRFATMEERAVAGGDTLNPAISIELVGAGGIDRRLYDLLALDRAARTAEGGRLAFVWIEDESVLADDRLLGPWLHVELPEAGIERAFPVDRMDPASTTVEVAGDDGETWTISIDRLDDDLSVGGRLISVATMTIESPDGRVVRRMSVQRPEQSRDLPVTGEDGMHGAVMDPDERIRTWYRPGLKGRPPLTIVAGPEPDRLRLVSHIGDRPRAIRELTVGEHVEVDPISGIRMAVTKYEPFTTMEQRPLLIPRHRRDPNVGQQRAMCSIEIPDGEETHRLWLPYHLFVFDSPDDALLRFPYQPRQVTLSNGRTYELMYSRERRPLPAPVVLHDFELATHVGGFSGRTDSIRDWRSIVRFGNADDVRPDEVRGDGGDTWTRTQQISMNEPTEHEGYWYFQSQWDAPIEARFAGERSSRGLNYTILGVGNRNGVYVMLLGCCISVTGMIYAFYFKPYLKRRRRDRVLATLAEAPADAGRGPAGDRFAPAPTLEPREPAMPVGSVAGGNGHAHDHAVEDRS